MALYRSDALALRRFNLGEADRIVSFLTRKHGKMRAVARSARRPKSKFAAAIEPLTHVHLEFYGKENTDLFRLNSTDVLPTRKGPMKMVKSLSNIAAEKIGTDLISDTGVAAILGMSKATIWRMVNRGELPKPAKIGQASRWSRKEIMKIVSDAFAGR